MDRLPTTVASQALMLAAARITRQPKALPMPVFSRILLVADLLKVLQGLAPMLNQLGLLQIRRRGRRTLKEAPPTQAAGKAREMHKLAFPEEIARSTIALQVNARYCRNASFGVLNYYVTRQLW